MKKGEQSAFSGNHVIFPMEAEAYVQELTTFRIADIGSKKYAATYIVHHAYYTHMYMKL